MFPENKTENPTPCSSCLMRCWTRIYIHEPWYSVLNSSKKINIKLLSTCTAFYHLFQIKAAILCDTNRAAETAPYLLLKIAYSAAAMHRDLIFLTSVSKAVVKYLLAVYKEQDYIYWIWWKYLNCIFQFHSRAWSSYEVP